MKFSPRDLLEQPVTSDELLALSVPLEQVGQLAAAINSNLSHRTPELRWHSIASQVLTPSLPFELHTWLFHSVYFDGEHPTENPIAWLPSDSEMGDSNVARLMQLVGANDYSALHHWTADNRADYWNLVVKELGIRFSSEEAPTLLDQNDPNSWLPAKRFNIAESCFLAESEKIAVVSQDENGNTRQITYGELETLANRVANGLLEAGFAPGDRIGMMLTMSIESVAAYLGTIIAGCVPVSIAESFASPEIAIRMNVARARAIITNDVIKRAGKQLPSYEKWKATDADAFAIVIPSRAEPAVDLQDQDVLWCDFLSSNSSFEVLRRTANSELNVLFSSGTMGEPKAIPWTHSTPLKCAADGRFHQNIHEESIVAWPTSLGWMMGPWLIFASLLNRATIALFEGAPNTEGFCHFVQDTRVTMLGVIPSLVRAWRNSGCISGLDWSSIEVFSSTGECSDPEDMLYLMSRGGYRPVIEYCGGTEIGGGYIASTLVQPNRPSCFSTPALGMDFVLLNEENPAEQGEVFLHGPSIGLSQTLLNADHEEVYFQGTPRLNGYGRLRRHGDALERLPDGSYRAVGRSDDAMNLGGIKVSAVEIERCLNQLPGVLETAAIATQDAQPSSLVVYAVLDSKDSSSKSDDASFSSDSKSLDVNADLKSSMQKIISQQLNPLFRIGRVVVLDSLPRTASNKIMRRKLRTLASDASGIDNN